VGTTSARVPSRSTGASAISSWTRWGCSSLWWCDCRQRARPGWRQATVAYPAALVYPLALYLGGWRVRRCPGDLGDVAPALAERALGDRQTVGYRPRLHRLAQKVDCGTDVRLVWEVPMVEQGL